MFLKKCKFPDICRLVFEQVIEEENFPDPLEINFSGSTKRKIKCVTSHL